jgi:hypothetical protein
MSDQLGKPAQYINESWYLKNKIRNSVTQAEKIIALEMSSHISGWHDYTHVLRILLANLWNAAIHDHSLITPIGNNRNKKIPKKDDGVRSWKRTKASSHFVLNRVLNYLLKAGYIERTLGVRDSNRGIASCSRATNKLLDLISATEDKVLIDPDAKLIILRDLDKNNLPVDFESSRVKNLALPARLMNQLVNESQVTYNGETVPFFLYRVFNKATNYTKGGRFYSPHTCFSKEHRRGIKIDGEKVCELDFKALHPTILYAEENTPIETNVYGFLPNRSLSKILFLILMNSSHIPSFKRNITRSGDPKFKEKIRRSIQAGKDHGKEFLGFINEVPDYTKGAEVYRKICEAHQEVAYRFGKPDLGLYLQYKDSQIMAKILTMLALEKIVALPVHDSVIVKESVKERVRQIMKDSFNEVFPHATNITIEVTCDDEKT